ncbi:hypothetical protein AB0M87_11795 [Streptomyces sp. NPDC051320]|uniref:hypothetical protein n=1 Tax=Streptomyces sp. NPDC051320 TaxID=3154644 RepID=UPI0034241AF8
MSRTAVRHSLTEMKKLLIATSLEPATLRGERPKAALAVLDPRQKDLLRDLNTSLAKPSEKHDPLSLFTRFDPEELTLSGKVVKTRGRMTFEAGDQPGTVDVHADYTFVYPVVRVGTGADAEVARTIVRRTLTGTLYDPAKYLATGGKLNLTYYADDLYNSACSVYDGYLHPQFAGESVGTAPTGPAADPYDRSKSLPTAAPGTSGQVGEREAECGVVSRT